MFKISIPKLKTTTLLICTLVMMYILKNAYIFRQSEVCLSIIDAIELCIYFILIGKIILSNYKLKHFIFILFALGALMICYLATKQANLLEAAIVILTIKDDQPKAVFKWLFMSFCTGILMVVLLYILGVSNPGISRRGGITLGFATVNIAARMFQNACFCWILFNRKQHSVIKETIVLSCVSIFLILTTGSRASAIVIAVTPFLIWFISKLYSSQGAKWIGRIAQIIPIIMLCVTLGSAYGYITNKFLQSLNSGVLSNRLYMNYVALDHYGFTLFGQVADISSLSGIYDSISGKYINFLTIDNQYVYLLTYFGLIGMGIWLISVIYVIRKSWKNGNISVVVISIVLCCYSLTETIADVFAFITLVYLLINDVQMNNGVSEFKRISKKIKLI